jgi:hypothetical protein
MLRPRRKPQLKRAPRARAAPFRWRLVVMAKVPAAGRVKTRLAREVGTASAVRFARHATASILHRLARDARWHTTVALAPDIGVIAWGWPRDVACVPQGNGDLGARMQRIFRHTPPGPVVIVGTDVPHITPGHIRDAFRVLGRRDGVFGPAEDGGYWLMGLRRRPRMPVLNATFNAVRWSGPHALSDTLANLRGHAIGQLATLPDVDTASDFARCAGIFGRRSNGPRRLASVMAK